MSSAVQIDVTPIAYCCFVVAAFGLGQFIWFTYFVIQNNGNWRKILQNKFDLTILSLIVLANGYPFIFGLYYLCIGRVVTYSLGVISINLGTLTHSIALQLRTDRVLLPNAAWKTIQILLGIMSVSMILITFFAVQLIFDRINTDYGCFVAFRPLGLILCIIVTGVCLVILDFIKVYYFRRYLIHTKEILGDSKVQGPRIIARRGLQLAVINFASVTFTSLSVIVNYSPALLVVGPLMMVCITLIPVMWIVMKYELDLVQKSKTTAAVSKTTTATTVESASSTRDKASSITLSAVRTTSSISTEQEKAGSQQL